MKRRYTLPNGDIVFHGQQFVANDGVSYPGNWLELASAEDLAAHGVTVEEVPDSPDIESPHVDGTQTESAPIVVVERGIDPRIQERRYREALQAIDDPSPTAGEYPMLAASIGIEVPQTHNIKTDFDAISRFVIEREMQWVKDAAATERARLLKV